MTPIPPILTIFAGPNGSGKSTLIKQLRSTMLSGYYLNADDCEKTLKEKQHINFGDYYLTVSQDMWEQFLVHSTLHQKALTEGYVVQIVIKNNVAVANAATVSSYEAALLVEFILRALIIRKLPVSFETVMSHPSKRDIVDFAIDNGYICNLHFVTTVSPIINIARVKDRVAKGGHDVPIERIENRYYKSLELLSSIIPLTNKTILYDNSGQTYRIIASIAKGSRVTLHTDNLPRWYHIYIVAKLHLEMK